MKNRRMEKTVDRNFINIENTGNIAVIQRKQRKKAPKNRCFFWQGQKDLNPRHAVLETAALPTELYPYIINWWAIRDSNPGPSGYEPDALTN